MRDQIMSVVTAGLELPPLNIEILVGHKENMFTTVSAGKRKYGMSPIRACSTYAFIHTRS